MNLQWVLVVTSAMFGPACSGEVGDSPEGTDTRTSSALTASTPAFDCERHQDTDEATTSTTGSTGQVEVSDFFIGATFYADSTIVRGRAQPECVAHIQSPDQAFSDVGTLVVGSDFVGMPGGPANPFAIEPDFRNDYFAFPDPPLFNVGRGERVQVSLAGLPAFPPIHVATLRSSALAPIHVMAPTVPASEVLAVSSTAPLRFGWEVPASPSPHVGRQRHPESVSMCLFALGPAHWGQLYCSWSTSAGRGEVPASLLSEFRRQLGGSGVLDASVDIYSGGFREFATPRSSYVVIATTDFATTFPRSTAATFE